MAPNNLLPANNSWHPQISQVVYWGMDWNCPSFNQRLSEMILANYGSISPETTISSILPGTQTGNLQAVVYDLTAMKAYFAFGVITPEGHHVDAFRRPFVKLDLNLLFAEKAPSEAQLQPRDREILGGPAQFQDSRHD